MADTYHPQVIDFGAQITATSTYVPAQSFSVDTLTPELAPAFEFLGITPYIQVYIDSPFIPAHCEIVVQMELYAPGSGTSWPDDKKPQYRIPSYATEPFTPEIVVAFPALTVAF